MTLLGATVPLAPLAAVPVVDAAGAACAGASALEGVAARFAETAAASTGTGGRLHTAEITTPAINQPATLIFVDSCPANPLNLSSSSSTRSPLKGSYSKTPKKVHLLPEASLRRRSLRGNAFAQMARPSRTPVESAAASQARSFSQAIHEGPGGYAHCRANRDLWLFLARIKCRGSSRPAHSLQ